VLEALEASIAAHPASGRREQGRPDDNSSSTDAKVLRLVPRRERAGTPHTPDAA
jgi:hypothetical protein